MCRCPHCGSESGRTTMPTLTGEPCLICRDCHHVNRLLNWLQQYDSPPDAHTCTERGEETK